MILDTGRGRQLDLFDGTGKSLYDESIKLIKGFEDAALARSPHGYLVAYSGGKDSDALVELFRRSGVKFKVYHNLTTLDAPETVYHVRDRFKAWEAEGIPCEIVKPRESFWALVRRERLFPTRTARFCCSVLKENAATDEPHAMRAFGVRRTESVKRAANRDSIEARDKKDFQSAERFRFDDADDVRQTGACYTKSFFTVNPLAYWSEGYLLDFIESERIDVNPLYGCGFKRVGCIGCPMASKSEREAEFARYPRFLRLYESAARDIWEARQARGNISTAGWTCWRDLWDWYMNA